ncbi:MAG: metallophosphoesterase [Chthonomonadales bacterium]|nr:metallophosphoesterase [Chthonomonadales bacterium]
MSGWSRRRLLSLLAAGTLTPPAGVLGYAHWIECRRLSITRLRIHLPRWPASRPLRVGQISDLHCDSEAAEDLARRAVALLMSLQPDLVALTGDYITSHGETWAAVIADALAPVAAAPLGAYAVLGNHDYWTESAETVQQELQRIGIAVLRNEPARVRALDNTWIIGVDSISTGVADAKVASIGVPKDAVKLMLVHEPDFADFTESPMDLQLSGHSHGGQIRLPGLPVLTPQGARRYCMGYYRGKTHPLFVSRGIGTIGLPLRYRCPPEVALLTLHRG